jgi:hypothetical protein
MPNLRGEAFDLRYENEMKKRLGVYSIPKVIEEGYAPLLLISTSPWFLCYITGKHGILLASAPDRPNQSWKGEEFARWSPMH